MAMDRQSQLEAVVAQLQARMDRLEAEMVELRERGFGQTRKANAKRTLTAAEKDDMVVKEIVDFLQRNHRVGTTDLDLLGYPYFGRWGNLRTRVAADLNEKGIPAPRGGYWSAKQISRALQRHSAKRMEARKAAPDSTG
ncbi:hypothetical protein [Roseomonas marmotae]|uniref:Recombinase domain-containing protein n=1 Tax=Roseomonas marmotae TaxID=2768161 RepID=A0ABS3KK85_9PROT|nr:hypothetical protein [Roseomonas marmotae]MBO1077360.1 hypothetical protein [Roseomonas marmotae]QTI79869.1 hypothetical protein IAI58_03475 [Roseomonas marmotae]